MFLKTKEHAYSSDLYIQRYVSPRNFAKNSSILPWIIELDEDKKNTFRQHKRVLKTNVCFIRHGVLFFFWMNERFIKKNSHLFQIQ